ncbi:MAG: hypothetical protein EA397_11055 [Deltaproteobacteria bacterium]|nr:MAG: hypothetical protein EA397_11055 [Deltaproteobacteria bacterium]
MFEPNDPSGQQLAELQRQLQEMQNPSNAVLRARLARASPWHYTRLATFLFLGLAILSFLVTLVAFIGPLVHVEMALFMRDIDGSLPLPSPVLLLVLTLCFAVAWVTAGQAVIAMAYDSPLLPDEDKRYRRLQEQLQLHGGGDEVIAPFHEEPAPPPLYMPQSSIPGATEPAYGNAAGGAGWPPQPADTPGGTLQYQSKPQGFGSMPKPSIGARTPAPANRAATPAPPAYATPAPAPSGTPAGVPRRQPDLSYAGPGQTGTPSAAATQPRPDTRRPLDGYVIGVNTDSSAYDEAERAAASWRSPVWGEIAEPWLLDAIRKAEELVRRYPVQAFIEYSVEPDLPFTLVIERATPAMTVRAMVEFVSFLASIATPKRARIELRSVVHLDRSFYRSVMSAMEPYFPDTVDIKQQGAKVEITFLDPDRAWSAHPFLPIQG